MADKAKKLSELTAVTSVTANDQLVIVANTGGTAVTRKVTAANFFGNSSANVTIRSVSTPANGAAIASVKAGTLLYDSSYLYIATANGTLKRVSLEAF